MLPDPYTGFFTLGVVNDINLDLSQGVMLGQLTDVIDSMGFTPPSNVPLG